MSLACLVNTFPRFASCAVFFTLMLAHLEWPDMVKVYRGFSLSIRKHRHKPRSLNCLPQFLLMSEPYTGVIALAHIPKVINMRFDCRVIFVINILHLLFTKITSLARSMLLRSTLLGSMLFHIINS